MDNLTPDERAFLDALIAFFQKKFDDEIRDLEAKGMIVTGTGYWSLGYDSVNAAKQAIEAPQN